MSWHPTTDSCGKPHRWRSSDLQLKLGRSRPVRWKDWPRPPPVGGFEVHRCSRKFSSNKYSQQCSPSDQRTLPRLYGDKRSQGDKDRAKPTDSAELTQLNLPLNAVFYRQFFRWPLFASDRGCRPETVSRELIPGPRGIAAEGLSRRHGDTETRRKRKRGTLRASCRTGRNQRAPGLGRCKQEPQLKCDARSRSRNGDFNSISEN